MKSNDLAQQLYRRDPLYRVLNDRLHLGPTKIALSIAILTCTALSIELLLAKMPLSDLVLMVSFQAFVIFPLAVVLYYAVPDFLAKPFMVLEKNGSVGAKIDDRVESYGTFREKMISAVNNFVWFGLALLMIVYYWYYRLFTVVPSDPSQSLPVEIRDWMRIALLVLYSPLLYMGVVTLGRILIGLIFIGRFFQSFKLRINPMSPDGLGGIGFVGQMLVASALIATAIGAAAAGLVYVNLIAGHDPLKRLEIIILGLLYLILTPLLFYSLMWSPHQALLRARESALKPLSDEYQRVAMAEAGQKNIDAVKSKTDHLVEIKRQYELIRDLFPVWPLNTISLRNLLATSILPAVSTLFSGWISDLWTAIGTRLGKS